MKAGIDPKTARRYVRAGQGPQELKTVHTWRTRVDPLVTIWAAAERWLEETPELELRCSSSIWWPNIPEWTEGVTHLSAAGDAMAAAARAGERSLFRAGARAWPEFAV